MFIRLMVASNIKDNLETKMVTHLKKALTSSLKMHKHLAVIIKGKERGIHSILHGSE